jgi:hypothetical protein
MEERMFVWPPPSNTGGVFAGVILERLKSDWTHVGFLYRREASDTYVLHLWGHRKLLHEPPREGQLCVLCEIEPVRLPSLIAFAHHLYQKNKNQGIPYAFSSPEQDWFSVEGGLLLGPERLGLTCANFVLAIFRAAGLPLVQLDTWPVREDDSAWQKSVLDEWAPAIKRAKKKKQKHFAQVRNEIGTVRCRPAEIGGAALASEFPCAFDTAVKLAVGVESALPVRPA